MFKALKLLGILLSLTALFAGPVAMAAETDDSVMGAYPIQPGDQLAVSVWKEEEMSQRVVVRPDGYITIPLVGEIQAAGDTIEALRLLITKRLNKFIPDPVVTVSVVDLAGNTVYVLGHVNRPGVFPMVRNIDVMQALSMAGGTSTYAALNDIKILRRENDKLRAMSFKYSEVEKGKRLEQNIVLRAGDVVVVP